MGTTLWFTEEDKRIGMPDALVAAGQYTICWNLLSYMERSKNNTENMTEAMRQFCEQYEKALRTDWERFQNNPLWMVKDVNP